MTQTATDWLVEQLKTKYDIDIERLSVTDKAKAMHKQQIIDAHKNGAMFEMDSDIYALQYYNETFGSHNSTNNSE